MIKMSRGLPTKVGLLFTIGCGWNCRVCGKPSRFAAQHIFLIFDWHDHYCEEHKPDWLQITKT